jgi:hypothetical protein
VALPLSRLEPRAVLGFIENFWALIKQKLGKERNVRSFSKIKREELWENVKKAAASIPKEIIANLCLSFPRRLEACVEARGGYTKY